MKKENDCRDSCNKLLRLVSSSEERIDKLTNSIEKLVIVTEYISKTCLGKIEELVTHRNELARQNAELIKMVQHDNEKIDAYAELLKDILRNHHGSDNVINLGK